ncbi:hypothetical protein [Nodularia chucula]|uniref:hypothetical protein n=1 Tax=Nodularia chucula TaxID=3093667 RepID=UPI0039C5AEBD
MQFINLDERTRQLMLDEVELDISKNKLYLSSRLSANGIEDYPQLLKEAITANDAEWLTKQLRLNSRIKLTEERKKPKGGYTSAKVPINAAEALAEGEFNRFYIRALCCRVIEGKTGLLEVYRAKAVMNPRLESQAKIGAIVNAEKLLADLRSNIGFDTALGIPGGVNSGLSVKII